MKRMFNAVVELVCSQVWTEEEMDNDCQDALCGIVELTATLGDLPPLEVLADYIGESVPKTHLLILRLEKRLKNLEIQMSSVESTSLNETVCTLAMRSILAGFYPYQRSESVTEIDLRNWAYRSLKDWYCTSVEAYRGFLMAMEFLDRQWSIPIARFIDQRYGRSARAEKISELNAFIADILELDSPTIARCAKGAKLSSQILMNLRKEFYEKHKIIDIYDCTC
ncbi:hypothetical protein IKF40_00515 [Candidatus Saccharibacteria bacterium]|nr:hypothetical protein [Candidatus Saccharibacteria bacterium]MBR2989402.1 hypothetical protein [Candidatus Saccharibacteria bacterium]